MATKQRKVKIVTATDVVDVPDVFAPLDTPEGGWGAQDAAYDLAMKAIGVQVQIDGELSKLKAQFKDNPSKDLASAIELKAQAYLLANAECDAALAHLDQVMGVN
jgi:hypothetical protein